MTSEVIDVESRELVAVEPLPAPALFGTTDPVEIIEKATGVANALKDVLMRRGLIAKIREKEYVTLEGWTTLGAMLGVFPVNIWTRPIEVDGRKIGWEARVEARTMSGAVVGAAEAECLNTEKGGPWKTADDFALRSMAQTRASSKALRIPLGFVVTLAGYSPTPAEEMTFAQEPERRQPVDHTRPAARRATAPAPTEGVRAPLCPEHQKPCVLRPAGVSGKGKSYGAFWSCPLRECTANKQTGKQFSIFADAWEDILSQQRAEQVRDVEDLTRQTLDDLPHE